MDNKEVEKVSTTSEPKVGETAPKLVPAKKVKFNLFRPVTNNGILYDAGDTLEIKESTADFLEKRGLGKRA